MDLYLPALLWIIFTLAVVSLEWYNKTLHQKCPPGPWGIPFVGFLLHSFRGGERYQKELLDVKKKYGKVATVRMGSFKCIWINDYDLIKEAFKTPVFCGRPKIPGITSRTQGFVGGLIFNDGPDFKEQRRFVVKHLKCIGGKVISLESYIMEEIEELVGHLNHTNHPISTRHLFNIPVMNVLWRIVTGDKFRHDDPSLLELAETLNRNMEMNGLEKVAFFMPWLPSSGLSWLIGWNSYVEDANYIFKFWRDYSKSKIAAYDPKVPPVFFIDHYIKTIYECQDPDSGFFGDRGELSLAATIQDLFIAGTETTSTTLSWALLYLAVFQNVQSSIVEEIERVVGQSQPSLSIRLSMPYTEAFLQELMRHATLAPLGIVHRTTDDTELGGYFIPKDSIVQPNIFAVHYDPVRWECPEKFEPARFLDSTGQDLIKKEDLIPFSLGGRHCIGETLARDELFLVITSIIQNFNVVLPSSGDVLNNPLVPLVGVGSIPKRHKLMFCKRKNRSE